MQPGLVLIFWCWLAVGAQRAVRGIAPMPRRSCERETGREADRKVAIWIDRPQGHMVESQAAWRSAASCLRFQSQNLMRLHWSGWGWELIEFRAELSKLCSFCLILARLYKLLRTCLGNLSFYLFLLFMAKVLTVGINIIYIFIPITTTSFHFHF